MKRLNEQSLEQLRSRLDELGMSQAELARASGLTPKHINQIWQGKAFGSPAMLDFIAFALGCEWELTLRPVTMPEADA